MVVSNKNFHFVTKFISLISFYNGPSTVDYCLVLIVNADNLNATLLYQIYPFCLVLSFLGQTVLKFNQSIWSIRNL